MSIASSLRTLSGIFLAFDGSNLSLKVPIGAHSKYNGKCLNLVKAKFLKAFLASFGSKNSTNAIVLAGGKTTYFIKKIIIKKKKKKK